LWRRAVSSVETHKIRNEAPQYIIINGEKINVYKKWKNVLVESFKYALEHYEEQFKERYCYNDIVLPIVTNSEKAEKIKTKEELPGYDGKIKKIGENVWILTKYSSDYIKREVKKLCKNMKMSIEYIYEESTASN
jgi:hypothetical protein